MEQTQQTTSRELPTLLGCKVEPMSKDQTGVFLNLCMNPTHPILNGPATLEEAKRMGSLGHMMFLHVEAAGVKATNGLLAWLTLLSDRPGTVALWAATLKEMSKKHPDEGHMLVLQDWTYTFPMGVPTAEEYERIWDERKAIGYANEKLAKNDD